MMLVCEPCGSHALATIEATHTPNGGREVYECTNCGRTGTLDYDATSGPTFTGCVMHLPSAPARRSRRA